MTNQAPDDIILAQGGGYGPPGGYGAPPPGGYGGPGGYGPPPGAPMPPPGGMPPMMPPGGGPMPGGVPGMGGGDDIAKQAGTWMIIAVVGILCCCPNVFSIVGVVFANQAKTLAGQGDLANAAQKLKTAKMITIIGLALGTLAIIGGIIAQITMGIANSF